MYTASLIFHGTFQMDIISITYNVRAVYFKITFLVIFSVFLYISSKIENRLKIKNCN